MNDIYIYIKKLDFAVTHNVIQVHFQQFFIPCTKCLSAGKSSASHAGDPPGFKSRWWLDTGQPKHG